VAVERLGVGDVFFVVVGFEVVAGRGFGAVGGAGGSARAFFFVLLGRRLRGRWKRLALLQRRNLFLRFLKCTARWVVRYFDEFADCEAHGSAAA
jgi:hypothetical protein